MRLFFSRSLAICVSLFVFNVVDVSRANSLLDAERNSILSGDAIGRDLVGRRLIDAEDWSYAEQGQVPASDGFPRSYVPASLQAPHYAYGQGAYDAFFAAYQEMVRRSADRLPTEQDYLDLHRIAARYDDQAQWYIQPRLEELKKTLKGKQKKQLLAAEQSGELVATGLFDDILEDIFGKFRKKKPYSSNKFGHHVFNPQQLKALRRNFPEAVIQEIETLEDGRVRAQIEYTAPEDVETRTREVFTRMQDSFAGRSKLGLVEASNIASPFYRGLLMTHGLVDVNGRMAKLMRDWVYYYAQQHPPLDTVRDDLIPSQTAFSKGLRESSERARIWVSERVEGVSCSDRIALK